MFSLFSIIHSFIINLEGYLEEAMLNIDKYGRRLEKELKKHLPLKVLPTMELILETQEHGVHLKKDCELVIDQALYIKKMETIYCSFYSLEYKQGVFTPIDNLQFQVEGKLADQILSFQKICN